MMFQRMSQQGRLLLLTPTQLNVPEPGTCSIQKQNAPLQVTCSLKTQQTWY